MIKRITLFVLIALVTTAWTQEFQQRPGGSITGAIYDKSSRSPIEYANIILFSQQDSTQITGTISDAKGNFQLNNIRPAMYYLEIRFMGFQTRRIDRLRVNPRQGVTDLGKIELERTVLSMEELAVEGEKPALTYEIDKKVIAVSQMQTVISGTAADVLQNVPSVTVDIQGNVSLRGSSNFTVLIDGRPTVLEPNDALQQIPASTIENIEIITNPSAKFDPDGTAGIINLVMKKNQRIGRSGLINLNGGLHDKYGGDFLLENRREKWSVVLGVDYNKRFFDGDNEEKNETTSDDLTSFIYSSGDSRMGRNSSGVRAAIEWYPSPKDVLTIDGRFGQGSHQRNSDQNYDEWAEPELSHSLYISANSNERANKHYSSSMSYLHRFTSQGHELSGQLSLSYRDGEENATNELFTEDVTKISGRRSSEDGPSNDLRTKIDYTLPLNKSNKFETGYQGQFNDSDDRSGVYDYDPVLTDYYFMPEYSHTTNYKRATHSVYALYSGRMNRLGFQGGLRGEYTSRTIELKGENEKYTLDLWDYFPTAHFSYELARGQQFMTSYTRRIERQRGFFLEPYETWIDAYNVRQGNPDIKPEYIDSYELGYQTAFGKNLFSTEIYYRVTHNKIERVRSVYDVNVTLHTVKNVGADYALGCEMMLNIDLLKYWNVNLMGNYFNYRIEGTLYSEAFSRQSDNWSARLNNVFKLARFTQLQINGNFNSPSVSAQGRREGFLMTDVAVKQEFFERTLSLTLQLSDIFSQAKHEFSAAGPNFYSYNRFSREAPIVMLNIRYNINNYKAKRDRSEERNNRDEMDDEEIF